MQTNHALQDQTDEKGHEDVAGSPRPPAQLVPGKRIERPGLCGGFNNKDKVVIRRPYDERTYDGLKRALYQAVGDLPTPKATHSLC